jgi:hypothetical protein
MIEDRFGARSRNMQPSFRAKFLPNGDTALQCKQTGTRYIIAQAGSDHAAYREGTLIRTGPRAVVVDAVESDARWEVRG